MDLGRLERIPSIKAVMTPFPYTIAVEEPLSQAEAIMRSHGVRHVPVENAGRIVGVVSDQDLRRAPPEGAEQGTSRVGDFCLTEPYVVDLEGRLDDVLIQMARRRAACALITREGKLVGIFTTTDACQVLADVLRARFAPSGGNSAA
ncbi:MAG: CBS domain-containing protein [Myxococcota bacterium]|jgi:acetoin utilization protein AcuB